MESGMVWGNRMGIPQHLPAALPSAMESCSQLVVESGWGQVEMARVLVVVCGWGKVVGGGPAGEVATLPPASLQAMPPLALGPERPLHRWYRQQ
eukprot:4317376-Amphidinium_carterae.1